MYQLMTGEPVSARDAYRMGMVVRLCPPAELMNIALEIAEKIARSGPTALAAAKFAVREGLGVPMEHRDDHQPGVPLEIRPPSGPWRRGQGLERDARAELQ
jgi:enoyl-CoA hydratase/carnithine racemase